MTRSCGLNSMSVQVALDNVEVCVAQLSHYWLGSGKVIQAEVWKQKPVWGEGMEPTWNTRRSEAGSLLSKSPSWASVLSNCLSRTLGLKATPPAARAYKQHEQTFSCSCACWENAARLRLCRDRAVQNTSWSELGSTWKLRLDLVWERHDDAMSLSFTSVFPVDKACRKCSLEKAVYLNARLALFA